MDSAPAMLSSPKMHALIQELRSEFAVVLFDTAPLAAGADPLILGTATGNLVLVMRTGATDKHLTEAKLGVIDRLPIRLLGAVLNDVPAGGVYDYYYRAYAYLPEYGAETEDASVGTSDGMPALPDARRS
jgi:Mrp family chromosome partitioning ATPase